MTSGKCQSATQARTRSRFGDQFRSQYLGLSPVYGPSPSTEHRTYLPGRSAGSKSHDAAGTDILSAVTDGVVELALVGAGRMGRMHLRALDPARGRTAAVRVTDVVEPITAAREALRGRGYRLHATLADLLAARRPDGVVVAAPTDRHAEVARAALAAGIPVLCEKPAGLTWQEVEETGCVAADRGVAFQVAYWRHFVPAMVALRERIVPVSWGRSCTSSVHSGTVPHHPAVPARERWRLRRHGRARVRRRRLGDRPVGGVGRRRADPALDAAARPDADNAQALPASPPAPPPRCRSAGTTRTATW